MFRAFHLSFCGKIGFPSSSRVLSSSHRVGYFFIHCSNENCLCVLERERERARQSKDSLGANKGLMASWAHHNGRPNWNGYAPYANRCRIRKYRPGSRLSRAMAWGSFAGPMTPINAEKRLVAHSPARTRRLIRSHLAERSNSDRKNPL
jgi:hypothetical protein